MKIILWIGVALLFLGAIIFAIAFAVSGFNFQFLSNVQIEYKTFEEKADNKITSLSIEYDTADVVVYVSADTDALSVQYPQKQNKKGENISEIKVEETDGKISITENYKWQAQLFSVNFASPTVSVYLPQERVYALDLQTTTGTIRLGNGNLSASKITLKATTGMISTKDCAVSSTGEACFETTTGIVSVGELSAQTVVLKTTTGKLEALGTITADTVQANATTGNLNITGKLCANAITLATTTGDLNARIGGKKADYSILVSHSLGDSNVSEQTGGTKTLNVSCTTGDIYVTFAE